MRDLSLLDKIIVGRVEPHIYAFTTNTIPNYIKVGDTYRPVSVRLDEWKKYYPELEKKYDTKAMVSDDIFFRDYSVHQFLEHNLQKTRLKSSNIGEGIYFSNEFFKDTSKVDIDEAIKDIKNDFDENLMKYQFYNAKDSLRVITEYASTGMWNLRPNQKEVVENFKKAYEAGRTNLLLYAVMRFGKSFTSMCCALEMNANVVLIVSAKADVKEEWKKTVQSADNFKDYDFIENDQLLRDNNIIKHKLETGRKVVMFLTLQDLQGTKIKEKHKELFNNQIDLLLIDETHFGARAESFGAVLRDVKDTREDEIINFDAADDIVKVLKSKVRIHLSGTPYRILMSSEFEKEDIIGFYQFSDIVKAQLDWDKEHILDDSYKEWENPYYGFPQMIRFAFNLNKSIKQKLIELKKSGVTYAFSELFRPMSITKDSEGKHKKFIYESEILDLLEVIDGSKNDDEVLGFLNFDKIKEGKMCRHIVVVLPFRASCDSFEKLIKDNKDKFKNLNDYEIINISGVDESNSYKSINDIKYEIKNCEKNDKKTITLTVNRMLTGSTVEEWDTMIYLKDTSSPQEYDQAIFRLQNQYVKDYISEAGDIIKYNKKPQTLLVDFNPNRMFIMQETKSLIYNVNTENNGNDKLKDRLENELNISPIIVFDSNKLKQITAIDIMNYISNYSNSRSVLDESNDLPVDFKLLNIDEIREIILKQAELGSKGGLKLTNTDDDTDDFEELSFEFDDESENQDNNSQSNSSTNNSNNNDLKKIIVNKFKTYYVRILFYSFLSSSELHSLKNIIDTCKDINNQRILKNLELDINILKLLHENIDPFVLSQLDYKIQNINKLSNDESLDKIERALVAINKFDKLSDSEIITPNKVCKQMISMIPDSDIVKVVISGSKILDIASKEGEFTIALYSKLKELGVKEELISNCLYSIPTSKIAYEFTRKIYEILNLNIDNIATNFTSYDLLDIRNGSNLDLNKIKGYLLQNKKMSEIFLEDNLFYKEGDGKMKFDIVVGNPPYQKGDGSGGADDSAIPVYDSFVNIIKYLSPNFFTLILPAKWMLGGRGLQKFREEMINDHHISTLYDFEDTKECFNNIHLDGGICYFLWDEKYNGKTTHIFKNNFGSISQTSHYLKNNFSDYVIRDGKMLNLIEAVQADKSFSSIVSSSRPFGIRNYLFNSPERYPELELSDNYFDGSVKIYGVKGIKGGAKRKTGYVKRSMIQKNKEAIDKYKLFFTTSYSTNAIVPPEIILGKPGEICTETFLMIGPFNTEKECINCLNYVNTNFFRTLLYFGKGTMHVTQSVFSYIPLLKFDKMWNDENLRQYFNLSVENLKLINDTINQK